MSSAGEQRLPEAPRTGAGGGHTSGKTLKKKVKKYDRPTAFFKRMLPELDNFLVWPYETSFTVG